jgi:hypothetical protein
MPSSSANASTARIALIACRVLEQEIAAFTGVWSLDCGEAALVCYERNLAQNERDFVRSV